MITNYREINYRDLYLKTLKEKEELKIQYKLQLMQDKEKNEKSISSNEDLTRKLIIFILFGLATIIGLVFTHIFDK